VIEQDVRRTFRWSTTNTDVCNVWYSCY